MTHDSSAPFYEFFAGGGMARLGLRDAFRCVYANDLDPMKARAYVAAFGEAHHWRGDVWAVRARDLPGSAGLAWASSPCQDLSLAGRRGGLNAPRSGAFWGFWRLIEALVAEGRAPATLVIENVCGLLTANRGADFAALCGALAGAGYVMGALEIDAALFAPQSRPRVFVVASRAPETSAFARDTPTPPFHSKAVIVAHAGLPASVRAQWRWWRLPVPPLRNTSLADILATDAPWAPPARTDALAALMAPHQRARLDRLVADGGKHIGAGFRRIRIEDGTRRQRFEARFDGLAGCVRTPGGGSSRQFVIAIEGGTVRSRLLTARECARLMGLPDDYPLPEGQTAALKLVGDGVAAPVAHWLGHNLLTGLCAMAGTTHAG